MNSELLLVVIPSQYPRPCLRGFFKTRFAFGLIGPRLEAAVEISEPFVGTARIRGGRAPGAFSDEKLLRSGWSGKLRKVRRVEGEYLADTSGEV